MPGPDENNALNNSLISSNLGNKRTARYKSLNLKFQCNDLPFSIVNKEKPRMRSFFLFAIAALSILGCKKNNNTSSHCYCQFPVNKTDSATLTGCWILVSTKAYSSIPGLQNNPWQAAGAGQQAIIQFYADSSFQFDDKFPWKAQNYDRYKAEGVYIYLYSSAGAIPGQIYNPYAGIKQVNNNKIIITRFGVDTGVQEMYDRY